MSEDEAPRRIAAPAMESGRRRGLGRGLDSLLGSESDDYAELDRLRHSKSVPIEMLHPGRYQPRRNFDEEQLASLVDSIRTKGVLQPVLVRRHPEAANAYEIIAGERRWRAAQLAQLHEIPIIIKDLSDREALEVALVENIQRQDLTAIEEADAYRRLMDDFGHTQEDMAHVIGKSRSHVANMLRLLTLPDAIRAMIQSGQLSAGHARALVGATDPLALAEKVIAKGLTVRQTEALAGADKAGGAPRGKGDGAAPTKDADTVALERSLENLLGLKVSISFRGKGGSLTIHYGNLDQLDDLCTRLSQTPDRHLVVDDDPLIPKAPGEK